MSRHRIARLVEARSQAFARLREVAAGLMEAGSGWLAAQRPGVRLRS